MRLGGNENDVKLFKVVHQGMLEDRLVDKVAEVSSQVSNAASQLSVPGVSSVRTSGTSVWVNTESAATTCSLIGHLRSSGILVRQNGPSGIMTKPSLLFGQNQVNELFGALRAFKN